MKADLVVIGGGPAGMGAALEAHRLGVKEILIIERDLSLGGILQQCIHNGFGLHLFGDELTGGEYAQRFIDQLVASGIHVLTDTMVMEVEPGLVRAVNKGGVLEIQAGAIILAMGCRERTRGAINIPGERPAGIYTAGAAQRLLNIEGLLPGKRAVILGSGDIGLIMARRLVLEGAQVEGVYEIKGEPSGLTRNLVQCLQDYNIPLHLSTTVTEVLGKERVEGVRVCPVDEEMQPQLGSSRIVPCDTLIISVGLIPENDIHAPLGVELDSRTSGPAVDQRLSTNVPGLFSCGNALHVNDLVDYVSESGATAGLAAAQYAQGQGVTKVHLDLLTQGDILYAVPSRLDLLVGGEAVIYLRSSRTIHNAQVDLIVDGVTVLTKKYSVLRPPEMERISLDMAKVAAEAREVILRV